MDEESTSGLESKVWDYSTARDLRDRVLKAKPIETEEVQLFADWVRRYQESPEYRDEVKSRFQLHMQIPANRHKVEPLNFVEAVLEYAEKVYSKENPNKIILYEVKHKKTETKPGETDAEPGEIVFSRVVAQYDDSYSVKRLVARAACWIRHCLTGSSGTEISYDSFRQFVPRAVLAVSEGSGEASACYHSNRMAGYELETPIKNNNVNQPKPKKASEKRELVGV